MNKLAWFSFTSLSTGCSKLGLKSRIIVPVTQRYFSDDTGDSDEKKKAAANEKLANLLKGLKTTESVRKSPGREIKLAKPGFNKHIKREKDGKPVRQNADVEDLDQEIVTATKGVARIAKTDNKKRKTESDLLKKLLSVSKESKDAQKDNEVAGESDSNISKSMSSLFSDMKVDKRAKAEDRPYGFSKAKNDELLGMRGSKVEKKELTMEQMAFLQKRAKMRRAESGKTEQLVSVDLFSGTPLGIFTEPIEESSDADLLKTWRACEQRELRILSTPPPRNALEEMVLQTKQGKLWHFPVDNEQGLDYSNDPFYQHVFLEHHLEPWCPKMGPVRHFMEVVCLGLSKNPYVSSSKKLDTILWFKNYFERPENNEILVHSGFWEESNEEETSSA